MKNFNHKPTQKEMRELWDATTEWIALYKPSCGESIYQVDSINIASMELAANACDIVGYYPHEED